MTSQRSHWLMTIALIGASIGLFEQLQGWVMLLCACACSIRVYLLLHPQVEPLSTRLLNLLAVFSSIILAWTSWQSGMLLAMVNLLTLACALKHMMLHSRKDELQQITSLFFLIAAGLVFQQGILYALLHSSLILILLAAMASFHNPNMSFGKLLKRMSIMSVQAFPIAVVLFLVLPQLSPFWQMPNHSSAQTGLSDRVNPGDIASLSQSSKLAYRATFENEIPTPQERYWRAMVLEYFDGETWTVHPQRRQVNRQFGARKQIFSPVTKGRYYQYEIITEPSTKPWLFALDIADIQEGENVIRLPDYSLIYDGQLSAAFKYTVRSFPDSPLNQTYANFEKQLNLQVPQQGNPRTREWVQSLKQEFPDPQSLLRGIAAYIQSQPFRYTLRPPLMLNNSVDAFLFEQQAGFCAHYASASIFALRLAGIPARMVTGYQGGEQQGENYLSVYQYDAHAWVEVWIDSRGWQRFDPTALVSPDRIESGLAVAMETEGSFLANSIFALSRYQNIAWLNQLRLLASNLDYAWSRWLIGYDKSKQRDLLTSIFGQITPNKLSLIGIATLGIITLLLILFFLPNIWQQRQLLSPVEKAYQQALMLLSKFGIERENWQGSGEFIQFVEPKLPLEAFQAFSAISQAYVSSTYEKNGQTNKNIKHYLKQDLKRLKMSLSLTSSVR